MKQHDAERMTEILKRIGGALIQAIPESWTDATLRVEVRTDAEGTSITHSIKSAKRRDIVMGSDDLFAATRELQLFSEQAEEPWTTFEMQVYEKDGQWKFEINFEYAD